MSIITVMVLVFDPNLLIFMQKTVNMVPCNLHIPYGWTLRWKPENFFLVRKFSNLLLRLHEVSFLHMYYMKETLLYTLTCTRLPFGDTCK